MAQLSGSYTIGGSGADFTTINDAISSLTTNGINGNTIFNINDGTYDEKIVIPSINGVSANDSIIFQSATQDSANVIITNTLISDAENFTIQLDGVSYLTFKDLTITVGNDSSYGRLFSVENTTSNLNFINLHMISKVGAGSHYEDRILMYFPTGGSHSNYLIDNCHFEHGKYAILTRVGVSNCIFQNNTVAETTTANIYLKYWSNLIVRNNTFNMELEVRGGSGPIEIYNNTFTAQLTFPGFSGTEGERLSVYNNMFSHERIYISGANYFDIYHNTISNSNTTPLFIKTSSNYNIINNIFATTSSNPAITIEDFAADTIHHNILFSEASIASINGSDISNIADLKDSTNQFENCAIIHANFISESDVHMCELNNLPPGTDLAITNDIDGDPRPTNPRIGADEYTTIPLPFLGTDLSACADESLTLSTGFTYPGYLWEDVSTSTTYQASSDASGNQEYILTVYDNDGCTYNDTVTILFHELPVVQINDVSMCAGNSATFDAGSHSEYIWSTNETTKTITKNTAETYSVTVTNANGCTATDATTLTVNSNPTPIIDDASTCEGQSHQFDAGTYAAYNWSNGETSNSMTTNAAGTYTITVTDNNGCTGTDAATLSIISLPQPTIIVNEHTLTSSITGTSYQWYKDDAIIPEATSASYTAIDDGNYAVEVTNDDNCSGISPVETLIINKIDNEITEKINIYPNPASTHLYLTGIQEPYSVSMHDITGKSIAVNKQSNTLKLNELAPGIYLLKIIAANKTYSQKLIIR
jgi:hypothetical protein